jgi:4-hydroxy-tetrahydrodipicolinate synthase
MTFHGVLTALVTPFNQDGLDEDALGRCVDRQIHAGVHGLVPCGTTGEAPTLTPEEHRRVIEIVVDTSRGRVPVLAGIGSNNTQTAIANAAVAKAAGAQGVLATVPYYNKPTQEGLYRHFRAIASATDLEVCLYNVPGRTSCHLAADTMARLADVPNITCVKEATGDMGVASDVLLACGDRLTLLSGDDFTTLPFIALGGHGCVSVASNVLPATMVALMDAARSGDLEGARAIHMTLYPLFKALFCETNPLPVKTALAHLGWLDEVFRLPLCEMSPEHAKTLRQTVDDTLAKVNEPMARR